MVFETDRVEKYVFLNRPWSPEEDQLLRELAGAKRLSREIAKELRRTLAGVRYRAQGINVALTHASHAR